MMRELSVIVVGAGIGGLQAALALSARGHHVTVLEAVDEFREVGAGIRVPPNSNLLSQSWGVDFSRIKKCKSLGNRFLDYQNNSLLDVSFDGDEERYGAPYYFLHRADLVKLLVDTAKDRANIDLMMGCKVVDYDFDTPSVQLPNGDWVKGDLIVACDGIKSAVRDQIIGQKTQPMDTGDVAYRILVDAQPLLEDPTTRHLVTEPWATHWIGPECHAVGYPLRNGELYNVIIDTTHATDLGEPMGTDEWRSGTTDTAGALVERFSDWCAPVRKLCALTGQYLKWKLAGFDQLHQWAHPSGKAVLLGDACHPMMPYMAQGAAQATEDAATLAAALSSPSTESITQALGIYQRQRLPRATYIARNTRVLQGWWHLYDGAERDRRDELMRCDNEQNPMLWGCKERKDWLFGFDARILLDSREEVAVPSMPPMVTGEADVYERRRVEAKKESYRQESRL